MPYSYTDFFTDSLLVLLVLALFYLLHSRGYIRALFTSNRVDVAYESTAEERETEEYIKKVRERKRVSLEDAREEKIKLGHMRDEAKKKLINGEIDAATYRDVLMKIHTALLEVEARIKMLESAGQ
ncbi:MAG: hypothetical protein NTY90_02245 [Candidatus Micrarchaeota archaeon]|nr:hypothetical protein [Candidatus Micrarchaeota archaeon]